MTMRFILAGMIAMGICRCAPADDKITLHENVQVGKKVHCAMTTTSKMNSVSTTNGTKTPVEAGFDQDWKVTLTANEVKDGSATKLTLNFDPNSVDKNITPGVDANPQPCDFAGKTIVLTLNPDDSITSDYKSDPSVDTDTMTSFISPDEVMFPDIPVAPGDTWDNTAKWIKFAKLGPKDKGISKCRLDWVKTIDGKQMARITNVVAIVSQEDGNVEEDIGWTDTILVDVAAGMIVKLDQEGSSKYITPPNEATQVTGGTKFTTHVEVSSSDAAAPATQP